MSDVTMFVGKGDRVVFFSDDDAGNALNETVFAPSAVQVLSPTAMYNEASAHQPVVDDCEASSVVVAHVPVSNFPAGGDHADEAGFAPLSVSDVVEKDRKRLSPLAAAAAAPTLQHAPGFLAVQKSRGAKQVSLSIVDGKLVLRKATVGQPCHARVVANAPSTSRADGGPAVSLREKSHADVARAAEDVEKQSGVVYQHGAAGMEPVDDVERVGGSTVASDAPVADGKAEYEGMFRLPALHEHSAATTVGNSTRVGGVWRSFSQSQGVLTSDCASDGTCVDEPHCYSSDAFMRCLHCY